MPQNAGGPRHGSGGGTGGGGGTGDVVGPSSSVDGEITLFSGTTGKLLKRASLTGLVKAASGVASAATAGTDYAPATSGSAILKGNGSGGFSSAAAGTDYAPATSGSAILKGNGSGGFSSAAQGTDYYAPGGTDVAVADGGTGASTAAGARTNLGLVIGTNVQAWSAILDAIAAGTDIAVADGGTGASTAAGARTNLGVAIGSNVQAWSAQLDAIAALSPSNDDIIQRKAGAWVNRTMAQLVADIVLQSGFETAVRAQSLDQMTAPAANVSWNSKQITSLLAGTLATDAPNMSQAGDFIRDANAWTRTGATTFTQAVDTTAYMKVGTKLRWAESSTTKYGVVKTAVFSAGVTTVTMVTTSDYSMSASPDANTASYARTGVFPSGFPGRFAFTPANPTGFSANPTTLGCWWQVHNGVCEFFYFTFVNGTSNATTYTVASPIDASFPSLCAGAGTDNGTAKGSQAQINAGTITLLPLTAAAWTSSGSKGASFTLRYPVV